MNNQYIEMMGGVVECVVKHKALHRQFLMMNQQTKKLDKQQRVAMLGEIKSQQNHLLEVAYDLVDALTKYERSNPISTNVPELGEEHKDENS